MTQTRLERGDVLFHEGDQGDRLYVIGEGKIKLGRTSSRRPREPPGHPRPGRDVRRAEPVRPRPAHRRPRPPSPRPSCSASATSDLNAFLSTAAPASPRPCSPPWPGGCAAPTRPSPTSSSPTSPAASPRRCSTSSHRFGRPVEDGILVAHDLTQEELAQLVGASRETVNKALADFAAPRLAAPRGPRRAAARRRAAQAPRPLTATRTTRSQAASAAVSGGCAGTPAGPGR